MAGHFVIPQLVFSGTGASYGFEGHVTDRYGVPLDAVVIAFAKDDNALLDSDIPDSTGFFSLSFTEPAYVVSLAEDYDVKPLGWGGKYV